MALETILSSDFAVKIIYPFLLVFTLVFAILQKSKILGEDKRQIDALVALAVGLIVVAFSWATNIIAGLMPFLAVSVVILLVFMILYGFVASDMREGLKLPKQLQYGIGILAGIALIIAVIVATGQWDKAYNALFGGGSFSSLASNILMIAIILGALAVVIFGAKKKATS
ncbi:hypothetical protein J4466_02430 [Candidatus Pacearchaeota archaeon]|nr:hypothetical protein [Candidatus Pacearchaeota archaeon]